MDFAWSREQQEFRREVAHFLARELPSNWEQIARKSPGSREMTEFSREFCPRLATAGLLVPHWPEEFGGRSAPPWEHFILGEMMWEVGEPRGPQYYNVNWIGPTIMEFGTLPQMARHLGLMASGNVVWCQGFSEPGAGSDLASLRTTAEFRDGRYILNGSKIWTSYAALADYCFLLARVPGEGGGITVFLMPMDRPGITVHPIRSVVGDGDLHEVFFDNVEIAADEVLGDVGQGWKVARFALHFERVGIPRYALGARVLQRTVGRMQDAAQFGEPARLAAASAHAATEAARLLTYAVVDRRARTLPPDGTTSIARYATVVAENRVAEFVLDFQPELSAGERAPMVETHHRRAIAAGIASGAAEIQLNIAARDVLGLGVRHAA
ncbi:MAG: acyl-CoA dehydrogenase family protein [Sphingomonadales bacterium]|nr:acyl-CoA dehydrogenase family protein [Sphingomonadales bacterium]